MMRLIAILLFCASANAATYYVDYTGGNDANNGTAKATAWKRAPGMKGAAMSYTHVAGDTFIFKGGVTWPKECYQWKLTTGGTSTSVQDVWTVDKTWYSGGSWTKPLFDFEQTIIGNSTAGAGVLLYTGGYRIFNELDFARHFTPTNGATWGARTICYDSSSYNTLTNCVIRDWGMPTNAAGGFDIAYTADGGVVKVNSGGNNTVTHCDIHQANTSLGTGFPLHSIDRVEYTSIHDTMSACVFSGNGLCYRNHIYRLNKKTNPADHGNAIMLSNGATIEGNVIHDCGGWVMSIFTIPGQTGPGTDRVFNNIVYNVGTPCWSIDTNASNDQGAHSYGWNNTFYAGNGYCVRVGYRSNGPFPYLELKNNHFITSFYTPIAMNNLPYDAVVTTFVHDHNLTNTPTSAAALGYTVSNEFAPTSESSPTVDAGTALTYFSTDINGTSRPLGARWDIGAYELGGDDDPVPGALCFSASTYTTAEDTTLTVTVFRVLGSDGAIGASYTTTAGSAAPGVDYTTSSGTVSLGDGVMSDTFTVPILRNTDHTGNLYFTVTLSSPTGGAVITAPSSASVSIVDTDPVPEEPEYEIPVLGTNFLATDMLMFAPYVETNGIVLQSIQTTTNDAGQLQAYVVIPTAGTYRCQIGTTAATTGSDSIFVRVNGTNDTCDFLPITSGQENRMVNWRGTGTFDAPQYQPMEWHFEADTTNLFVIYGREANCGLSNITFVLNAEIAEPPPDPPAPVPSQISFEFASPWFYDNRELIQLNVNKSGTNAVTVDYSTTDGTATAGTHYTATSGTLTFASDDLQKSISIPVLNVTNYTTTVFTVELSNVVGLGELAEPTVCAVALVDEATPATGRTINARTVNVNVIVPKP